jgi:hypothetical protein
MSGLFFGADRDYGPRLKTLLPLYALRWSQILLNEFLPECWEQRVAAGNRGSHGAMLALQLTKAKAILAAACGMAGC